jgi:hypothetical protein
MSAIASCGNYSRFPNIISPPHKDGCQLGWDIKRDASMLDLNI